MDNMDGFSFIFNNEGLFDFKDKKEKNTTSEPWKNEDLEQLKRSIHIKNQIILKLLSQCEGYSGVVDEIIKGASTNPDIDIDTKNKIGDISKSFNDMNKLNGMLKIAIELEEMMESNDNHTI